MATTYYTSLFKKSDVRITQAFSSTHKGLDLSRGVVEQPIYFPNKAVSGEVWKILSTYTSGGVTYKDAPIIYIKHKDGSGSRYIHSYPRNVKVKVGDKVVAGQEICKTGNAGHSFGDHLHFEWLKKWDDLNSRIDPKPFVINDKPVEPQPTECEKQLEVLKTENKRLTEALAASQEALKTANERIEFLEQTLLEREKEYKSLQEDYDRVLEERNRFEQEKLKLQEEIDSLKSSEEGIIKRVVEAIVKLFRGE